MKRNLLVFTVCLLTVSAILFLIPGAKLFDGEVVFEMNGRSFVQPTKLSLSYFIGIMTSEAELKDVKDFYLLPVGYLLAALMLFALPAIVTYRIHLQRLNKQKK